MSVFWTVVYLACVILHSVSPSPALRHDCDKHDVECIAQQNQLTTLLTPTTTTTPPPTTPSLPSSFNKLICPTPYEPLAKSCYHFEVDLSATWNDALSHCQSLSGGHLLEVETKYEATLLLAHMQVVYGFGETCLELPWVWIGGVRQPGDAQWKWYSSGLKISSEVLNWRPGQPNEASAPGWWMAQMSCADNYTWYDRNPGLQQRFICEVEPISFQSSCDIDISQSLARLVETTTSLPLPPTEYKVLCPIPYIPIIGGCYYVEIEKKATWDQANKKCATLSGGHLAEFQSKIDLEKIKFYLKARFGTGNQCPLKFAPYIGAAKAENETVWKWSSSGLNITSPEWHSGQPNEKTSSGTTKHVAHLWCNFDYAWFDQNPEREESYICEVSPPSLPLQIVDPSSQRTTKATCPSPYVSVGRGCYYVEKSKKHYWYDAKKACAALSGGHLLELETDDEAFFFKKYIKANFRKTSGCSSFELWIGAVKKPNKPHTEWEWDLSGLPVTSSQLDWQSGQPDNSVTSTLVAYMHCNYDYRWYDAGMHYKLRYICEF